MSIVLITERAADHERQQSRPGGDGGENDGCRLERVDQRRGRDRLHAGDLVVDPIGQLVEVLAGFAIDVDPGRDGGGVDMALERRREGVAEEGLAVFEAHEREAVGGGAGLVEDAYNRELVADVVGVEFLRRDGQLDGVADLLLELLGDVGPEHDLPGALGVDGVAGDVRQLEVLVLRAARLLGRQLVAGPEGDREVEVGLDRAAGGRAGRLHASHVQDLLRLVDGDDAAEAAVGGRADGDMVAEVADAAVDEAVRLLGQRAHRRSGRGRR